MSPTPDNQRLDTAGVRSVLPETRAYAIMAGLTESFMIPYALALGASALQAGLLSSVRNLILSLSQLTSAGASHWLGSRKRLVIVTAQTQTVLWLPLSAVGWLFGPAAIPALIVLYTLGTTCAAFASPAWGSLVSEQLAPEERGRFFGRRNRALSLWMTVASLLGGALLQVMSDHALIGFALLCLGAAAARAVSCRLLRHLPEGPWQEPHEARFSFWQFLTQARTSNFARFSLCMGALHFAAHLASPYLAVYMLTELHYDYLTYTVVTLAGTVTAFLAVVRWGHIGDRHGNWVILRLCMLGVAVLPVLWSLSGHPAWLLAAEAASGVVWGGVNLAMVNFVYDAASPAKRTRCLAYFNVINGIGISAGALAGGWLLGHVPPLSGSTFVTLFCLASVARLAVALVFPRLVRETRAVRPVGAREVVYDLVGQSVVEVFGRPRRRSP